MKKQITKTLILTSLLLLMTNISCDKQDDNKEPELKDLYVIDVSQDTDWDYWVVGKEGDYFFIKQENSKPTIIFYKPTQEHEGYPIFLNEDGLPEKAIIDNIIFLFGNYKNDLMDMAVLLPNGDVQILRDIDANIETGNLKTSNELNLIKIAGMSASVAACGIGLATSWAAGVGIPIAIVGCGATALHLAINLKPETFESMGFNATTVAAFATVTGCISSGGITCALGLASLGAEIVAERQETLEERANQINSGVATLDGGHGDIQVNLTWDNFTDLDLHVIDPAGEEIYYGHQTSQSGGWLDVDDIDGEGPENISWSNGEAPYGNYQVYLNHYSGNTSSYYTVIVIAFGHTKTYIGVIYPDETIHIADFDQHGIYDGKKSANMINLSFKEK